MARDQSQRPMTDAEIEDAREAILEQREDIREFLADEGVDVSGWGDEGDEPVPEPNRDAADSD